MSPPAADPPDDDVSAVLAASRPATVGQWLRLLGNVTNLSTVFGLAVGAAGGARFRWGPRGLVLGEGYRFRFPVAGAFTIGNVCTTGGDWDALLRRMPALLRHEERHTWQYLYCLGLPFYLAYAGAMGWSWLRTGDRAARNVFERRAGLADGGYLDRPTRSVGEGARALGALIMRTASGRRNRPAS